jgi:hypothetical protein
MWLVLRKQKDLKLIFHLCLKRHSDHWYQSIFSKDKVSGEITPTYYWMSDDQVRDLSQKYPDLKVIIILRDPVERIWSNYKMDMTASNRNHELGDTKEPDHLLQWLIQHDEGYATIISRWQSHFKDVMIGYYDQIKDDPKSFLKDILLFLGCRNLEFSFSEIDKPVNQGNAEEIPNWLKQHIIGQFQRQIEQLAKNTDSKYPRKWISSYQNFSEQ